MVDEFLSDHKGITTNVKVDLCRNQNLNVKKILTQKAITEANLD